MQCQSTYHAIQLPVRGSALTLTCKVTLPTNSQQGRMRHEILLDVYATYRSLRDTGKDDSAELQALLGIAKLHGIDEDDLDDHYMRTS